MGKPLRKYSEFPMLNWLNIWTSNALPAWMTKISFAITRPSKGAAKPRRSEKRHAPIMTTAMIVRMKTGMKMRNVPSRCI